MATWKAIELGAVDGKPAITWQRFGVAAKGEPSIVSKVETYDSEYEALQRSLSGPKFSE